MRYRPNRQEQTKAHQLELRWPSRHRTADNDSDPFGTVQGSSRPPVVGMKSEADLRSLPRCNGTFEGQEFAEVHGAIVNADGCLPSSIEKADAYPPALISGAKSSIPALLDMPHIAEIANSVVGAIAINMIDLTIGQPPIDERPDYSMSGIGFLLERDLNVACRVDAPSLSTSLVSVPVTERSFVRKVAPRPLAPYQLSFVWHDDKEIIDHGDRHVSHSNALLPKTRELTRFEVDRAAKLSRKIAARGLTLADAIARDGPADQYAECYR